MQQVVADIAGCCAMTDVCCHGLLHQHQWYCIKGCSSADLVVWQGHQENSFESCYMVLMRLSRPNCGGSLLPSSQPCKQTWVRCHGLSQA
jgi:hypothetical protein